MSNIVTFESAKLPSFVKPAKGAIANPFGSLGGSGGVKYKFLSIKGKTFTVVDGDSRQIVERDDGSPASSIETVILAWNPHKSKVYYSGGYTEGSSDKPLCYSNNGETPEADAQEPQAKKCAICPHNVFGSKITENGKKAKSCADSVRVAIAQPDLLADPMLLRVPAGSIIDLVKYGQKIGVRGVEPHQVITRIGFDYTVAHQKLVFDVRKEQPFVTEEQYADIMEARNTDIVKQIIGVLPTEHEDDGAEVTVPPPQAEAKVAAKPAPAPAPKAEAAAEFPAAPANSIKTATKKAKPVEEDIAEAVGEMVDVSSDDLDFDD